MNDARTREESDALDLEALRSIDRKTQNAPKPRPRAWRHGGGRLVALAAFSLLAGGVALGASRHHAQHHLPILTKVSYRLTTCELEFSNCSSNTSR
jgi:hypothetical protein